MKDIIQAAMMNVILSIQKNLSNVHSLSPLDVIAVLINAGMAKNAFLTEIPGKQYKEYIAYQLINLQIKMI